MRPAIPGTGRIADHFPSLASRKKPELVTASGVFLGPIPMNEKSRRLPRTLSRATALLEMGSGSGSTPESATAKRHRARKNDKTRNFFIDSRPAYPENNTRRPDCQLG